MSYLGSGGAYEQLLCQIQFICILYPLNNNKIINNYSLYSSKQSFAN